MGEQFTLAPGASQSMTAFKSKRPSEAAPGASPNSSVSGGASGQPRGSISGPITKIKEKSERSLGMDVARTRGSIDAGTDYETMTGFTRRQSGIPGSRNGSRPPSRAGSNLSIDSDENSRGGVRRTSSMRSGGSIGRPPYRQTPVGFGSSTPRKTSTPVTNGSKGRTPSNSSADRTPMAGRMRSKSYITPRPSELIKSTSATNIPKFVGCYSNNSSAAATPLRSRTPSSSSIPVPTNSYRSRTPSSSSIPVPINHRTRTPTSSSAIQRSGSGLSDARRTSKTTTSYGADGSRLTSTTSTYSTSAHDSSQQQQTSQRNW